MDESPVDLRSLRSRADRVQVVVSAAMRRIARPRRVSLAVRVGDRIRSWSWPVAVAASFTAVAAASILVMARRDRVTGDAWEDVLATSVGIPPALAGWSLDGALPTTAELMDALWGGRATPEATP
jgi:hypothetical protein